MLAAHGRVPPADLGEPGKRLEIPGPRGNDHSPMTRPPLLPQETLVRVLRIARFDGLSVLVVAGVFALLAARVHDISGAAVGLLIAGAGAVELHGAGLLKAGRVRGMRWLVGSQVYLLCTVLVYVALRLTHVDLEPLRLLLNAQQRGAIEQAGMTEDQFLRTIYFTTYVVFGALTLIYQGSMSFYYHHRRAAVGAALAEPLDLKA